MATKITEGQVRAMIAEMKGYVINRDLPQCKQLIRDFVKEVIVYRNHVEVIFNMVFYVVIQTFYLRNVKQEMKLFKEQKCKKYSKYDNIYILNIFLYMFNNFKQLK